MDASAGIAGDMLLAALLDAGASLEQVCRAVACLEPTMRLEAHEVWRAGLRALKVEVVLERSEHSHRHWADIRTMLAAADLGESVRCDATAVFQSLAHAEAAVHGVPADQANWPLRRG